MQIEGQMMSILENITIDVEGEELDFMVKFNMSDSCPDEYPLTNKPYEYEILDLYFVGDECGKQKTFDASFMMDRLTDAIVEKLKEKQDERL